LHLALILRKAGRETDAIAAFEADDLLREAMGNDLSRAYLQLRKYDLEQFKAAGNEWTENAGEELTDWELEHYLPFY
jgi:glutamine synthetase